MSPNNASHFPPASVRQWCPDDRPVPPRGGQTRAELVGPGPPGHRQAGEGDGGGGMVCQVS